MRIQNANYHIKQNYASSAKARSINFSSLSGIGSTGNPITTAFYRDFPTLEFATNYISTNFPKGTNILDYACSKGDEALSIAILLEKVNQNKIFKIIGLDVDSKAIEIAKEGLYCISEWDRDKFLLNKKSIFAQTLKRKLMEYLTPTNERIPNGDIKVFDSDEFYKIKEEKVKGIIEFRPTEEGNIFDVTRFEPEKPVGAIFFRNAFYQLTGNRNNNYNYNLNIIKTIADAVHQRLEKNGIFVIGNFFQDHFYQIDAPNKKILAKSTENIMMEYKGFTPIFESSVDGFNDVLVHTVWKKI